ncbi:MAG TPA: hypothetical protein PLE24_02655 [Chitinispirillaceae bacterium]|jgi:hypothetical protein|nr:hypothetical protein [Chitinispirillaceae bacterium]
MSIDIARGDAMGKIRDEIEKLAISVNRKKEIPLDYSLEIENEGLTRESMEKQKKFSFRRYPEIMEIKKNDKKL